ncbi:MAG: restriction endonuclease [Lachnospiraceae bacterium]|nr:restriction endonuclease [Lachnospiraceae bacterium]
MFDSELMKDCLNKYKESFSERWKDERYKWEAAQWFQAHWDINAENFYQMFTDATEKTYNLLASMNNFPRGMIQVYSEQDPEAVRAMFINLFDESKDVSERVIKFQSDAQDLCDRLSPGKQHYQRPMAITVYLWLHNPDKYSIFKYTTCRAATQYLKNDFIPKKGNPVQNIKGNMDFIENIRQAVNQDSELTALFDNARDDTCYADSDHRTLAFDVSFFIAHYVANADKKDDHSDNDEVDEIDDTAVNENTEFVDINSLHSNSAYTKWMNAIVVALRELGGSTKRKDVHDKIIEMYEISEDELAETHKTGASKVLNSIDWARNYLTYEGILDHDSPDGIWTLSALGQKIVISDDLAGKIIAKWNRINTAKKNNKPIPEINLEPLYEYITVKRTDYKKYTRDDFLDEVYMTPEQYDTLKELLLKKKNLILQGAPGVGKTFAAKRLAYSIMGCEDKERIEFIQFHQNYSYEDFIMGYKPAGDTFELEPGVFFEFCKKAADDPERDYFFIIDEINRGNLSKIFGELLMAIEADYRGTEVKLAYNKRAFSVPKNLYLIGMMNTADRSLALIDYALRRRFSFFTMEPGFTSDGFQKYQKSFENDVFDSLIEKIRDLNMEITKDSALGSGFCIGHSYFCGQSEVTDEWMQSVVEYDILPMLEEYWFDDSAKIQKWQNVLRGVFND